MRLKEWEETILKITEDCKQTKGRPDRVLMKWRARLEKEPALLKPFQIDEIIREVRQRLNNASQ